MKYAPTGHKVKAQQRPGSEIRRTQSPERALHFQQRSLCPNRLHKSSFTSCSRPKTGSLFSSTTCEMISTDISVALSPTCQAPFSRPVPSLTISIFSWRTLEHVHRQILSKPSKQGLRNGSKPKGHAMRAFIGKADTGCFRSALHTGRCSKHICTARQNIIGSCHFKTNIEAFVRNMPWRLMSDMFGIDAAKSPQGSK